MTSEPTSAYGFGVVGKVTDGTAWQVNPVFLGDMVADPDTGKAIRVMKAMMKWTRSTSPP